MATTNDSMVELRGLCSRETIDILDAISTARRISRIELVNEVLGEWCVAKVHEANMVYRVARGNPALTEATGRRPE